MIEIPLDMIHELSEYARDTAPPDEFIGSEIKEYDDGSYMIIIRTTRGPLSLNFDPDDNPIHEIDPRIFVD